MTVKQLEKIKNMIEKLAYWLFVAFILLWISAIWTDDPISRKLGLSAWTALALFFLIAFMFSWYSDELKKAKSKRRKVKKEVEAVGGE